MGPPGSTAHAVVTKQTYKILAETHFAEGRGGVGYPVRQEKLPLGSEEVGQVPVLAVFHHHHEWTWRSKRFHEWWRCSERWQAQSSARARSPLGLVQAPTRFTTFR